MAFSVRTVNSRQAFQQSIAAGLPAYWEVAPGIEFGLRREPHSLGLALEVQSKALRPQQVKQALERRFDYPAEYADCFLFLDPQRSLVVWHALPDAPMDIDLLNDIQSQQLSLVGLDDLDERPATY